MKGTPQKVVTFGGLLLFLLATPRGSKLLVSGDMSERKVKVAQSCLTCRWILYQLNHKGSLKIWEWVAYPFSRVSSLPRSSALQVDSLPAELSGKPKRVSAFRI